MAEQDIDRELPATPYKLEQARKKGQVAKSTDVVAVALLGLALAWVQARGDALFTAMPLAQRWSHALLAAPELGIAGAAELIARLATGTLVALAPLLVALMITAVVAALVQTGPIWSTEPIKPDFTRLNPVNGWKRLMSVRTAYQAGASTAKLLLLALTMWWALSALAPALAKTAWIPVKATAADLPSLLGGFLGKLWIVLLVLALMDLLFTRWEFGRQMRMSMRDLKDEHKHREGDPRIRRRQRELRRSRAQQLQAIQAVPDATVVITNPTRVAVALRYSHDADPAPRLVAKGAGQLARQIREMAYRHGVPIVQNPPLARGLFRGTGLGDWIGPADYQAVARILMWLQATRSLRTAQVQA